MRKLGQPHTNTLTRTALYTGSIICLVFGTVGAFGSLMTLGQGVKSASDYSNDVALEKDRTLIALNAEAEVSKAQQKSGLGYRDKQLILEGYEYKPDTFFSDMKRRGLRTFPKVAVDGKLVLLDEHRMVIGRYDNGFICDTDDTCKKLEKIK